MEGGKGGKNSKEGGRVGKERERREKISMKGEEEVKRGRIINEKRQCSKQTVAWCSGCGLSTIN